MSSWGRGKRVVTVLSTNALTDDICSNLLDEEVNYWSDVCLCSSDGSEFHAHKVFLIARSKVLGERIQQCEVEQARVLAVSNGSPLRIRYSDDHQIHSPLVPRLSLDVAGEVLECLLVYVYTDKIKIPNDTSLLPQLIGIAEELEVRTLVHVLRKRHDHRYRGDYLMGTRVDLPTLASDLGILLDDVQTSDVCISVEGRFIHAHRAVLCARSSYFRRMFSGRWSESLRCSTASLSSSSESATSVDNAFSGMDREVMTPKCTTKAPLRVEGADQVPAGVLLQPIYIEGVCYDSFMLMMRFLYTNEVPIAPNHRVCAEMRRTRAKETGQEMLAASVAEDSTACATRRALAREDDIQNCEQWEECPMFAALLDLCEMASYFMMDALQAFVEGIMGQLLHVSSVAPMWQMARARGLEEFDERCHAFFIEHFHDCVRERSFLSMDKELLREVLAHGKVEASTSTVLDALTTWGRHNAELQAREAGEEELEGEYFQRLVSEMLPPRALLTQENRSKLWGREQFSLDMLL